MHRWCLKNMESYINLNNVTLHAPFDYIEAPNAEYLKSILRWCILMSFSYFKSLFPPLIFRHAIISDNSYMSTILQE